MTRSAGIDLERAHPARTEREARKISPGRGAMFIVIDSLKLRSSFKSVIYLSLLKELG